MIKRIAGYPGYFVTENGDVYSALNRTALRKLKPGLQRNYLSVLLKSEAGKFHNVKVHHAVMWAWVGPRPAPHLQARHLDGNSLHNHYTNLAWGTAKENANDRRRHGTLPLFRKPRRARVGYERGANRASAKISESDARYIKAELSKPWIEPGFQGALARYFGVSGAAISKIKAGVLWSFVQ